MRKIVLFGSKGQVGSALYEQLIANGLYDIVTINDRIDSQYFDTKDDKNGAIKNISDADVVVNCIAESDTRKAQNNFYSTNFINAEFPVQIAKILNNNNKKCKFIHISSGCIFDGNKTPNYEESTPTPLIHYALQKYQAESVRDVHNNSVILRPRMIFSDKKIKSNILYKISTFTELIDEKNSMTCVYDLVNAIMNYMDNDVTGTIHCCNKGLISPLDVKRLIYALKENMHFNAIFCVSKEQLHDRIGLKLTNTWIESRFLESSYNIPDVHDRFKEMILQSDWLI